MPGTSRFNDGRLTSFAPGAPRVVIRPNMRSAAKVNLRALQFGKPFDFRVIFLQPMLDERFVTFDRSIQRLLTRNSQLGQQTANRRSTQPNAKFRFDKLANHLPGP